MSLIAKIILRILLGFMKTAMISNHSYAHYNEKSKQKCLYKQIESVNPLSVLCR